MSSSSRRLSCATRPPWAAGSSLVRVEQTVQLRTQPGAPGAQVLGRPSRDLSCCPPDPVWGCPGAADTHGHDGHFKQVYSLSVLQVRSLTWPHGLSGEGGTEGSGGSAAHNGDLASQNASLAFWLPDASSTARLLAPPPPAQLSPRPSRFLSDSLWLAPPISDSASCSLIRTLVTTCRPPG